MTEIRGDSPAGPAPAGLPQREAERRLRVEGCNELPRPDRRSLPRIVLEVLREPMFGLLLAAGVIYLLLGSLEEALLLLAFATISVAIAIVQESRSEAVLEALRDLTSPRALVIRDGERRRIPGREVVRGDLLVLAEGDRVPADAVLLSSQDLETDESLLTGESVPVRKTAWDGREASARPGGDDLPFVFSGTMVVRGHGLGTVRATGPKSEIGKIGAALGAIESAPTRLALQTRQLVRGIAVAGAAVSLLAVLLYGTLRGSWLDGLLGGIALGMSMLPEEFPLVLTVFMVMGAWRISQARVLTRQAATIETLGAATVLCTDKTGTLTWNRMSIAELRRGDQVFREGEVLPGWARALVEQGILASAIIPFEPMEKAFHDFGRARDLDPEAVREGRALLRAYGLRPDLLAVTQVWSGEEGGQVSVAAKGAPEAIARLCRLDGAAAAGVLRAVEAMAGEGMRVLGIAAGRHQDGGLRDGGLPDAPGGFEFEFLGLVGLADPLRPGVREAVAQCRAAGLRVVMITGDYPATARAIACQAGIDAGAILTGEELARLSDAGLAARIGSVNVFARIMPEQKFRIVTALKAAGEIVGMTGDGVNDAPSLKAADIGIAMGGRGTDVAREASDIVLLDDDFGSIVRTVRLGRRIYDNLRKAMGYILAIHVPIAGLALLPLIFGLPLVFGPVHIAFLEMVIDPVCSIVFEGEAAERDIMNRPPRRPDSPLFSPALVVWGLIQGAVALALVAGLFAANLWRGMPEEDSRALAFVTLVLVNLGLILVNRSFDSSFAATFFRPNRALWFVTGVAGGLLALILHWLPARHLFQFGPLHADDLAVTLVAGLAVLFVLDAAKSLWRSRLLR